MMPFEFRDIPARIAFLGFGLLLYGAAGSTTPDAPGWAEAGIAFFLVLAVRPRDIGNLFHAGHQAIWQRAAQCFLAYGLSVPLMTGILAGHDAGLIVRDVVPFFFTMIPVFIVCDRSTLGLLWPLVAMVGVLFSGRVLFDGVPGDPLYLSIAPCVVFAAIVLMAEAGGQMMAGISVRRIIIAALCGVLALLCFAALYSTLQRASIGLAVGTLIVLLGGAIWIRPRRAVVLLLVVAGLLGAFYQPVMEAGYDLVRKQEAVGLNMRMEEAQAVFDTLAGSPLHVLFGLGWGANLESPAVGGLAVNYTHSLLSYLWLKTGLVGVICGVFMLFWLGAGLLRIFPRNPALALAAVVPLVIDTFLYASFKSLDFGLILLVCAAAWAATEDSVKVAPEAQLV